MPFRPIAAALLSFVILVMAPGAFATPQARYGTGLWINPDESGWGLNLFHQGDILFGALFVYGQDGRPRWYVASSLQSGDDGPLHDRAVTYTGGLYEATGPWFGGPFDASRVTRRQVGTMTVDLGDNGGGSVTYSIDGVNVTKSIRPFTFRAIDLSGRYVGYLFQPATTAGPETRNALQMTIQDNGSALHITEASDFFGPCTDDGTRGQNGQISTAAGTFSSCGSRGSGAFSLAVDMTPDGLTGSFVGNGMVAPYGRIALSRRNAGLHEGNGWRTDLWFPPNESGWGVNVVEQGDTIFATIFVYDPQGASHWYVASELTRSTSGAFTGALFESTGPYFGGSFNPSAVTRRQVGTMTFDVRDRASATLSYTVDGVSVTKSVSRFALRKNSLTGTYLGHLASSEDDPAGASAEAMSITIDDGNAGFTMRTQPQGAIQPRSGANCTYTATAPIQFGEQRLVSGTYTCDGGSSGAFTMDNVFVTYHGFTATFQGAWVTKGHMEGVRTITAPPRFSFVTNNAVTGPGGTAQLSVQRTGGIGGAFDVNYVFQGDGCAGPADGFVRFGDGDTAPKSFSIPMRASGMCTVALIGAPSPAEVISPKNAVVTVVPPVAGCPMPSNVVISAFGGVGNPILQRQLSGQTVFMPLPPTSPGRASGSVVFSESAGGAFTPQPVTLEISINRCPGIVDTDTSNFCNLRSTNGNYNSITFLSQAVQGIDRTNANQRGYCWAGDGGQYYVNARWTYPRCPSGVETCGFAIQYNEGPF